MEKALVLDSDKCTGCTQCEVACSTVHEGASNPAKSRIKIFNFHDEGIFVPYTCTQCSEAWCLQVCPVDAITVAGTGAKVVSDTLCVGCKVCTIACPFGTVNYNTTTGKVNKCDLCDGDPACVKACPTGAITYTDAGATGYDKMKSWAKATNASSQATV